MYKITFFLLLTLCFEQIQGQDLSDMSFGTEDNLEILTWNIENFPKNGQATIDSVEKMIEALDVDIIALQEIWDTAMFTQLLLQLEDFDGYLDKSYNKGLAYVYKTATVEIIDFYRIYRTSSYWNYFPRAPLVMKMRFNGQKITLINNHLKCCGDGLLNTNNTNDQEYRRYQAMFFLKKYIDENLNNEPVILLGDLNDNLADTEDHNVFQGVLEDTQNYQFLDLEIAESSQANWSYPSWPSHLDHILISDELFYAFSMEEAQIQTLRPGDFIGGFWEYESRISDHRPVGLRLPVDASTVSIETLTQKRLTIYPNPSNGYNFVSIRSDFKTGYVKVYNPNGQLLEEWEVAEYNGQFDWQVGHLPSGVYYLKYFGEDQIMEVRKIVLF